MNREQRTDGYMRMVVKLSEIAHKKAIFAQ